MAIKWSYIPFLLAEIDKNRENYEYIKESNRIKKESCKSCMEQLKDVLSNEQLEKFEDAFYSAVNGYILKRKD